MIDIQRREKWGEEFSSPFHSSSLETAAKLHNTS